MPSSAPRTAEKQILISSNRYDSGLGSASQKICFPGGIRHKLARKHTLRTLGADPSRDECLTSQDTAETKGAEQMAINVIVDISHHNGNVDLNKAKQAGIAGVIHKGTQGTETFDWTYKVNRQKAEAAGLMWGAYHFGTKGDGAAQADFFLSKINADEQTLLVLDYEPNGPAHDDPQPGPRICALIKRVGPFPGSVFRLT